MCSSDLAVVGVLGGVPVCMHLYGTMRGGVMELGSVRYGIGR